MRFFFSVFLCAFLLSSSFLFSETPTASVSVTSSEQIDFLPDSLGFSSSISTLNDGVDDFESFDSVTPSVSVWDPLERYNRAMFSFNYNVYKFVVMPVSKGYSHVLPKPVRIHVGKFFKNLYFPVRFANNLLQGKLKATGIEISRFLINSTVGFGGFFDPALALFNLEPRPEDFGQTLGVWGVKPGPYFVMPILGPSNLRDGIATFPNAYVVPTSYLNTTLEAAGAESLRYVNELSMDPEQFQRLKSSALDFYIMAREASAKLREDEVRK